MRGRRMHRQHQAPAAGTGGSPVYPPRPPGRSVSPRGLRFPPARRRGVCGEPQGDAGGEWERPGERECAPAARPRSPRSSPGYRSGGSRRDPPGTDPLSRVGAWAPAERSSRGSGREERESRTSSAPNPPCVSPRYLLLGQAGVGGAALPVGGDAGHGATGQAPRPAGGSRVRAGGAGGWSRWRRGGRGGAARPGRDGAGARRSGGDGPGCGGMEERWAGATGGGRRDAGCGVGNAAHGDVGHSTGNIRHKAGATGQKARGTGQCWEYRTVLETEHSPGHGAGDTGYKAGGTGHKIGEIDAVPETWDTGWGV